MVILRKETLMEVHGKLEQKEACCDNTDNETNEMFKRQRLFCQPDKLNLISGTETKLEGENYSINYPLTYTHVPWYAHITYTTCTGTYTQQQYTQQ